MQTRFLLYVALAFRQIFPRIVKRFRHDSSAATPAWHVDLDAGIDCAALDLHHGQGYIGLQARRINGGGHLPNALPGYPDRPELVVRSRKRVTVDFQSHLQASGNELAAP